MTLHDQNSSFDSWHPENRETTTPPLRDILSVFAAEHIILSPKSKELNTISRSYVGGKVRRYSHPSGVTKTDIDLKDGRLVTVHKNIQPVMGLSAARFDSVVVSDKGEAIGTIELRVDRKSSPTNPSYDAFLDGRGLLLEINGDSLDLALADDLLGGRPVAIEQGFENIYGVFGSAGYLSNVVSAMTPGYTEADFNPQLFS